MLIEDFQPQEIQWCEICRPHISGECDGCHTRFLATDVRYRSSSHHFHPGSVQGIPGNMAIHKELCVDCYRQDFSLVYRQAPPSLPDRGMDPRFWGLQQIQKRRDELAAMLPADISPEARKQLEAAIAQAVK